MALPFWTVLTFLSRHPIVLHLRQKTASRTRRHNFSICSGTAPRFYLTWPCVARNCWGSSGSVGGGVEGKRKRERERGGIDYRWGKAVEEEKKKRRRRRKKEERERERKREGRSVPPRVTFRTRGQGALCSLSRAITFRPRTRIDAHVGILKFPSSGWSSSFIARSHAWRFRASCSSKIRCLTVPPEVRDAQRTGSVNGWIIANDESSGGRRFHNWNEFLACYIQHEGYLPREYRFPRDFRSHRRHRVVQIVRRAIFDARASSNSSTISDRVHRFSKPSRIRPWSNSSSITKSSLVIRFVKYN